MKRVLLFCDLYTSRVVLGQCLARQYGQARGPRAVPRVVGRVFSGYISSGGPGAAEG